MRYWDGLRTRPNAYLIAVLAFTLVLAVACGSASAPVEEAQPADTSPAQQPVVRPPAASAAPTAAPQTMAEPAKAMMEVNPGKLTIMVGDLANTTVAEMW